MLIGEQLQNNPKCNDKRLGTRGRFNSCLLVTCTSAPCHLPAGTRVYKEVILATYLKALNSSQFGNLKELKNIFEQNITPSTLLQSAIERCIEDKIDLTLFKSRRQN